MMNHKDSPIGAWLQELCHHRWSIPLIAALHGLGGGAKFITLQKSLGLSRDSLKRTLEALIRIRLIRRNPGYGHPMRPEYILTSTGSRLAPACARLSRQLDKLKASAIGLNKWSLPVVYALSQTIGRFNPISAAVGGPTPRALAATLKDLQYAGLVMRFLVDDDPPHTEYALTRRGKLLIPDLSELVGSARKAGRNTKSKRRPR